MRLAILPHFETVCEEANLLNVTVLLSCRGERYPEPDEGQRSSRSKTYVGRASRRPKRAPQQDFDTHTKRQKAGNELRNE